MAGGWRVAGRKLVAGSKRVAGGCWRVAGWRARGFEGVCELSAGWLVAAAGWVASGLSVARVFAGGWSQWLVAGRLAGGGWRLRLRVAGGWWLLARGSGGWRVRVCLRLWVLSAEAGGRQLE